MVASGHRSGRQARTVRTRTRAFLAQAADAAEALDWNADDPWHALTGALKQQTGRKGKALFLPLRQALTGAITDRTWPPCCR